MSVGQQPTPWSVEERAGEWDGSYTEREQVQAALLTFVCNLAETNAELGYLCITKPGGGVAPG